MHDVLNRCEANAGPGLSLGREVGIEDTREDVWRHALSRVRHGKVPPEAPRGRRVLPALRGQANRDPATVQNGVAGIGNQVGEDLSELRRVHENPRRGRWHLDGQGRSVRQVSEKRLESLEFLHEVDRDAGLHEGHADLVDAPYQSRRVVDEGTGLDQRIPGRMRMV